MLHETLYVLHSPVQILTAKVILAMYTRYLDWYSQMPEVLRLGRNSTPSVLFTQ